MAESEPTVWLYCTQHADGCTTGFGPDAPSYEIRDHLVAVPQHLVADKTGTPIFDNLFYGKYTVPRPLFRRATQAEIAQHLAQYPERAAEQVQPSAGALARAAYEADLRLSAAQASSDTLAAAGAEQDRSVADLRAEVERLQAQLAALQAGPSAEAKPARKRAGALSTADLAGAV